jgi:hypothetical protein
MQNHSSLSGRHFFTITRRLSGNPKLGPFHVRPNKQRMILPKNDSASLPLNRRGANPDGRMIDGRIIAAIEF